MSKEHTDTKGVPAHSGGLFAAANSGKGFASFYEKIFSDDGVVRRYLIKGGPGTGKSSFMRRVADAAESEGYRVEYYRCSSDYTSLDGIVIEGKIALIDSTAPHVMEPELAGAKDEILNLGVFWHSDALFEKRDEISDQSRKKSDAYAGAYRFLEGALALDNRSREISNSLINNSKLERAAQRMIEKIARGEGYECRVGICNSVGMKGRARLDYYEKSAGRIYVVEDHMCTAHLFLAKMANNAVANRNKIRVSFDPVNTSCIDALLFEDSSIAFVSDRGSMPDEYAEKISGRINMKRFLQYGKPFSDGEKRKRAEFRADRRTYEALLDSAVACLEEAGEAHFALEKIYGECMDFEAERRFCDGFAARICDELSRIASK